MNFKAKPIEIEAFQFTTDIIDMRMLGAIKAPEWFRDKIKEGLVATSITPKGSYICIYTSKGDFKKAYIGYWICNHGGNVFCMSDNAFNSVYDVDNVK